MSLLASGNRIISKTSPGASLPASLQIIAKTWDMYHRWISIPQHPVSRVLSIAKGTQDCSRKAHQNTLPGQNPCLRGILGHLIFYAGCNNLKLADPHDSMISKDSEVKNQLFLLQNDIAPERRCWEGEDVKNLPRKIRPELRRREQETAGLG